MSNFKVLLNDINLNCNQLKIDAAIVYPFGYQAPKVRLYFTNGKENRRLPLPSVCNFNRSNASGEVDNVLICSYTYFIANVFNDPNEGDIGVKFELSYSDKYESDIEFVLSDGLILKSENVIDPKFRAGEEFNGVTILSQPKNERNDILVEDDASDYSYIVEPEKKQITLLHSGESKKQSALFRGLSKVFFALTFLVNILLAVILLPYFVIDGLLAGLGLLPRHKYKPVEGVKNNIIGQIKVNISSFLKAVFKGRQIYIKIIKPTESLLHIYYRLLCHKKVVPNRVSFISGRRDELGGNEKCVYDLLKDEKDIDFRFLLFSDAHGAFKFKNIKEFFKLYATSKVVIVDDYFTLLNSVEKRKDVTLFQLWHACGAFKTFGFTRLKKKGGPKQTAPDHRMYDFTTVSSAEIAKFYAEGFGISDECVLPTGVPRTDIFSDKNYAEETRNNLYKKYPQLKDKKVILFAPTFRGMGQKSAYYPLSAFDPEKLIDTLGNDYAVILKLHPFCNEKYKISSKYSDSIIDLSAEDELNDLLFITDILITDYSSVIFEASLLNIPMLFYSYDLYQYISERDFYCDYQDFVPGKIVFTTDELFDSIRNKDFEHEKVLPFRDKFFTNPDGNASRRVADAILKALDK